MRIKVLALTILMSCAFNTCAFAIYHNRPPTPVISEYGIESSTEGVHDRRYFKLPSDVTYYYPGQSITEGNIEKVYKYLNSLPQPVLMVDLIDFETNSAYTLKTDPLGLRVFDKDLKLRYRQGAPVGNYPFAFLKEFDVHHLGEVGVTVIVMGNNEREEEKSS